MWRSLYTWIAWGPSNPSFPRGPLVFPRGPSCPLVCPRGGARGGSTVPCCCPPLARRGCRCPLAPGALNLYTLSSLNLSSSFWNKHELFTYLYNIFHTIQYLIDFFRVSSEKEGGEISKNVKVWKNEVAWFSWDCVFQFPRCHWSILGCNRWNKNAVNILITSSILSEVQSTT